VFLLNGNEYRLTKVNFLDGFSKFISFFEEFSFLASKFRQDFSGWFLKMQIRNLLAPIEMEILLTGMKMEVADCSG